MSTCARCGWHHACPKCGHTSDEPWGGGRRSMIAVVVVESPYAGPTDADIGSNVIYARACLRDCLERGEAPFASHLLYTQPGVLDDNDPQQRKLGIVAGLSWGDVADLRAVYVDRGLSEGMAQGIRRAQQIGQPIEYRYLGPAWV